MMCSPDKKIAIPKIFWEAQNSGTKVSFRGLSVVNESVAWASGSDGTFTRTIDGGKTWQTDTIPGTFSLDFRDVQAFDANTAIVISAGRPAKIFKTIDGGKNWTEKYSNDSKGIFFNSMAFWDAENGIAVGDPIDGYFTIIITSDSGETWSQVSSENIPPARVGEANFAASGTCITVQGKNKAWFGTGGSAARVFYSADRGRRWKITDTPVISGSASMGIFSLAFSDEKNGIAVGGDYRNPTGKARNTAITEDGGITWNLIDEGVQPNGYRSCVAYLTNTSGKTLLAVGTTGTDISFDSGFSWVNIGSVGYHSIGFASSDAAGWAVGSEGRIAKLIDKNRMME
ncbi:MAG: hypothetical protein JSW07_21380 [bacterium]|nr:MAG: hypothetical protein JSW07_21380 [bacterium]